MEESKPDDLLILPEGRYYVAIQKAELMMSKMGNPIIHCYCKSVSWHKIIHLYLMKPGYTAAYMMHFGRPPVGPDHGNDYSWLVGERFFVMVKHVTREGRVLISVKLEYRAPERQEPCKSDSLPSPNRPQTFWHKVWTLLRSSWPITPE